MPFNLETGEWEEPEEPEEDSSVGEIGQPQTSILDPVKEQGVLSGGLTLAGSMIPGAAAGYSARQQAQTDGFSVTDIFKGLGSSDLPYYIPGVGEALGLKHAIQAGSQNTDAVTTGLSRMGYLGILGIGATGAAIGGAMGASIGRQVRINRGIADMNSLHPHRPVSDAVQTMISPSASDATNLYPSSVPSSRRSHMMAALHEVELAALEGRSIGGKDFVNLARIKHTRVLESLVEPIAEAFIRGVTGKHRKTGFRHQEVMDDVMAPFMMAMGERYKTLPAFRQKGLRTQPGRPGVPEFDLVEYITREFSKFDYALENDMIRMVHPDRYKPVPGRPSRGQVASFTGADEPLGPNRALPGLMHESPDIVIKAWKKLSTGKTLSANEMKALSETMFSFAELTQQIAHPELMLANPLTRLSMVSIKQYRFIDQPTSGQLTFETLKFPRRPRGSEQIHHEVMNDLAELYNFNSDALISLMTKNLMDIFGESDIAAMQTKSTTGIVYPAKNTTKFEVDARKSIYDGLSEDAPKMGSLEYDAASQHALSTLLWGFSSQSHPEIKPGTPMMAALENVTRILGLDAGPEAAMMSLVDLPSTFWDNISPRVSGELVRNLRSKARENFNALFLDDINQPLDEFALNIVANPKFWDEGIGPKEIVSTSILDVIQEPLPAGFVTAAEKTTTLSAVPVTSLRTTSFDEAWGIAPPSRSQQLSLITDSEGNINIGGDGYTDRLLYSTVVQTADGQSFIMARKRPAIISESLPKGTSDFLEILAKSTGGQTGGRDYTSVNQIPGLMEGEIIALSAKADVTELGKPTSQQLLKVKLFLESQGIEFEATIDAPHKGPTKVHVDEAGNPVWDAEFAREQGYKIGDANETRQQVILKFKTPEDLNKAVALLHSPETLLRSAATGWDNPSSHHPQAAHHGVLYNTLYGPEHGLTELPRRIRRYDIDDEGMSGQQRLIPVKHETDMDLAATIARDYDALPEGTKHLTPEELRAWDKAAKEIDAQFHYLTQDPNGPLLKVEFVDYDPYTTNGQPDYPAMIADIQDNNTLKIMETKVTGSHPLWTDNTNNKFRAIHDYFGHAGLGNDFGRHGEDYAFAKHFHMFSPEAQKAIFVETKGQNSSLIINGDFAPQKVGFLKSFKEVLTPEFQKKWWVEADESGQMTGPGAGQGRVVDTLLGEDVLDLVIYSNKPVGGAVPAYEHHFRTEGGGQHLVHNSMQGNANSANTVPVQIMKGRYGLEHFFGGSNTSAYKDGFTTISDPTRGGMESGQTILVRGGLIDMVASGVGDSIQASGIKGSGNPLFDGITILREGERAGVRPQAIILGMGTTGQHPSARLGGEVPAGLPDSGRQRKSLTYVADDTNPYEMVQVNAVHQVVIRQDGSGVVVELPIVNRSADVELVDPNLADEVLQLLHDLGVRKISFEAMDLDTRLR